MIRISLYILGAAIMLCGILIAAIIYISRQFLISSLSDKYLRDYSDNDTIPDELAIKLIGSLILRVTLIIFTILLIETAGGALLIVGATI